MHLLRIGDQFMNLDQLAVADFDTVAHPNGAYARAILHFVGADLPTTVVLFRQQAVQLRDYLLAHADEVGETALANALRRSQCEVLR